MAATSETTRRILEAAAGHAQRAPSILNTQPWRWSIHDDALDLYADRTRRRPEIALDTDPPN